jgi:hypothetical protein
MTEHDANLLPRRTKDADWDWAVIPTGTSEEFGLPPDATFKQKQVWQKQEAFLEEFRRCGKRGKAAVATGLTRWAVIHGQRGRCLFV